jgi:hypothetical protein
MQGCYEYYETYDEIDKIKLIEFDEQKSYDIMCRDHFTKINSKTIVVDLSKCFSMNNIFQINL